MKSSSISFIGILLLIAVLLGAAAIILYRVKVNRALQGKESGAHTNIPAPADSLSGIFKGVILILLIVICINLGKLNTLQQEIENLRDNVMINNSSVVSELGSLKSDLAEMNSRVYSYENSCIGVDVSDNTCTVKHTVRLKSFSDETEVVLILGDGTETNMVKTGTGRYEAELKTGLFKEISDYPSITVKENGTSYVEKLTGYSDESYYWQTCIPSVIGQAGPGITYSGKKLSITNISLFSEYKHSYNIASAKIDIEVNGKEADSIDAVSYFEIPVGNIEIPVNKEYSVNESDDIRINLILVTEEGYTLDQLLFEVNEGRHISYGNKYTITDKNGNKVF